MTVALVTDLVRYPVKGLSPEALEKVSLVAGGHFPGDRMFAVENGPSGFNPDAAEHLPKIKFLMLMRQERLAKLRSRYDDASGVLSISMGGSVVAAGDLGTDDGRAAVETFLEQWCGEAMRGPARVLAGPPGYRFMDSRRGFMSIINAESVSAIARIAGRAKLDPLRFRGNVVVEGLEAFGEFALTGQRLQLGEAVVEVIGPIDRCAAINVDPQLGIRDLDLIPLMEQQLGHHDCGVYARVIEGGVVHKGDAMRPLPQP